MWIYSERRNRIQARFQRRSKLKSLLPPIERCEEERGDGLGGQGVGRQAGPRSGEVRGHVCGSGEELQRARTISGAPVCEVHCRKIPADPRRAHPLAHFAPDKKARKEKANGVLQPQQLHRPDQPTSHTPPSAQLLEEDRNELRRGRKFTDHLSDHGHVLQVSRQKQHPTTTSHLVSHQNDHHQSGLEVAKKKADPQARDARSPKNATRSEDAVWAQLERMQVAPRQTANFLIYTQQNKQED